MSWNRSSQFLCFWTAILWVVSSCTMRRHLISYRRYDAQDWLGPHGGQLQRDFVDLSLKCSSLTSFCPGVLPGRFKIDLYILSLKIANLHDIIHFVPSLSSPRGQPLKPGHIPSKVPITGIGFGCLEIFLCVSTCNFDISEKDTMVRAWPSPNSWWMPIRVFMLVPIHFVTPRGMPPRAFVRFQP